MRFNVTPSPGGGGVELDPPPPLDINDLFELEFLRTSATNVHPFEEVDAEWSIRSRGTASLADYIFTLVAGQEELATDINATGSVQFTPYRNTLLRIRGKIRGGADSSTLGDGVALTVDEKDCLTIELTRYLVDGLVTTRLSQLSSSTSRLRLRRTLVVRSSRPLRFDTVEREVEPTWEIGVIKYYFPLEVVIPHFFNADLDVHIELRFTVHYDGDADDLEVTLKHSSDLDFDTFENIASLGSAPVAAKTANKLIPLILTCEGREIERELARQILRFVRPRRDTHRLLAVRVVPDGNLSYVAIVLCPIPESEGPDPVVVDPEGPGRV